VPDQARVFWELLGGVRPTIAGSLVAITIAAVLRLIPPAATGFALDHALGQRRRASYRALVEAQLLDLEHPVWDEGPAATPST